MALDTNTYTACPGCGGPILWDHDGPFCPSCDKSEVVRLPKSDDVLHRQYLMIQALKAGNRKAAHFWARCAAGYRQLQPEHQGQDDWVDRCGR